MNDGTVVPTTSRLPALPTAIAGRLALRLALPLAGYYATAFLVQQTGKTLVGDILFPLVAFWFLLTYTTAVKSVEGREASDARPFSMTGALVGVGLALAGLIIIVGGVSLYLSLTTTASGSLIDAIRGSTMSMEELLRSRTVAMAVAAKEEILFRALLFRWLLSLMPPGRALVLQAVLFGAEHWVFGTFSVLNATLVGLTLGVLYLRTHNLWLVLGFHFAWDFFIYVLAGGFSNYVRNLSAAQQQDVGTAYFAVFVLCQALLVCLAVWLARKPGKLLRPA
ncbi:MAG: CPBP family intramembrane glutamic endopeptidase [Burkholderiales bacterium]|nr:CPBP family intramembrane glutamic endopeptidase [Burkholderiales bacterium]